MCADYPVAKITTGNWGDDFPSIRIVGETTLDLKAEAYMGQITYGSVNEETATANAILIAAAPDLLMALQAIEHRHSSSPHIGLVRAAIAKATGSAR